MLVDKPEGWTSFDVVNYVRRIVATKEAKKPKNVKVGHCGTLDPFATGLLIILVGKDYTRRASDYSKQDKDYEITACLGKTSTTGDPEGKISKVNSVEPSASEIELALNDFRGSILQTPPIYSAIKVDGQRAYKLARTGKEFKLEPRQVSISRLEVAKYDYPKLELEASVSSGTYVRSLVEDIGKQLNSGAYTKKLRRTKIGDFSVIDAAGPDSVSQETIEQLLRSV